MTLPKPVNYPSALPYGTPPLLVSVHAYSNLGARIFLLDTTPTASRTENRTGSAGRQVLRGEPRALVRWPTASVKGKELPVKKSRTMHVCPPSRAGPSSMKWSRTCGSRKKFCDWLDPLSVGSPGGQYVQRRVTAHLAVERE